MRRAGPYTGWQADAAAEVWAVRVDPAPEVTDRNPQFLAGVG